eukprot:GHVN01103229.1.p1 GENE.GHVN01103229.1~~GHVN01103229.1.p1  ORF type:complete len:111 (-),score=14.49 GHVN01103229.1:506-838(-)
MQPIEQIVASHIIPNILGASCTTEGRAMFSPPARHGRMGICELTSNTGATFSTSREMIKGEVAYSEETHLDEVAGVEGKLTNHNTERWRIIKENALDNIPVDRKRVIERI